MVFMENSPMKSSLELLKEPMSKKYYSEIKPAPKYRPWFGSETCSSQFCLNTALDEFLMSKGQLAKENLPIISQHLNQGTSIKILYHISQMASFGKLQKYDYGTKDGYEVVEIETISLPKITCPVEIFYSQNDEVIAVEDVEKLADQLPRSILTKLENFHHNDFLFGKDASEKIYEKIICENFAGKLFVPSQERAARRKMSSRVFSLREAA